MRTIKTILAELGHLAGALLALAVVCLVLYALTPEGATTIRSFINR